MEENCASNKYHDWCSVSDDISNYIGSRVADSHHNLDLEPEDEQSIQNSAKPANYLELRSLACSNMKNAELLDFTTQNPVSEGEKPMHDGSAHPSQAVD